MNPVLTTGQSWQDPYSNLSLSVTSATSTALTIGVNYAAMPCTRGTPSLDSVAGQSGVWLWNHRRLHRECDQHRFVRMLNQRLLRLVPSTHRLGDIDVSILRQPGAGPDRFRDRE